MSQSLNATSSIQDLQRNMLDEMLPRLRKEYPTLTMEYLERALAEDLPLNWEDLFAKCQPNLQYTSRRRVVDFVCSEVPKRQRRSWFESDLDWRDHRDHAVQVFHVETGKKGLTELKRMTSSWPSDGDPLLAIEQAAGQYIRPRKIRDKGFYELRQQAFFAALNEISTLIGFWTIQLRVLFPRGERKTYSGHMPQVRVDVHSHIFRQSSAEIDRAFVHLVIHEVKEVVRSLNAMAGYAFDDGVDSPQLDVPLAVVIQLPSNLAHLQEAVFNAMSSLHPFVKHVIPIADSAYVDEKVLTCHVESEDEANERLKPPPEPVQQAKVCPGEAFYFLEFPLDDLLAAVDGRFYRARYYQLAHEFTDNYGMTPNAAMDRCGLKAEAVRQIPEYEAIMNLIARVAPRLGSVMDGDNASVLKEAVQLYLPVALDKQPRLVLRLLVDVATNVNYARIGEAGRPTTDFLRAATSNAADSQLATKPKQLKIAKTLLALYPDLAQWCAENEVAIIHPRNGFDAGAHIIKQWRADLVQGHAVHGRRWWDIGKGPTLVELSQWVSDHSRHMATGKYVRGHYTGATNIDAAKYKEWLSSTGACSGATQPSLGAR